MQLTTIGSDKILQEFKVKKLKSKKSFYPVQVQEIYGRDREFSSSEKKTTPIIKVMLTWLNFQLIS
jgi:hypothetical protein